MSRYLLAAGFFLAIVAANAEMLPVNDLDGDGIPNDIDNCLLTFNPFQEDEDNDEVGDACDVCPGVDDRVDEDGDGRPDCLYPPSFDKVKDEWKCGKDKKKVYVTFYPNPNSNKAITQCISLSALKILQFTKRNRRIYLGLPPPPKDCNCNGLDEDGDGIPDDDFIPIPTRCGRGACSSTGHRICVNGKLVDTCVSGTPAPIDSTCNGIDDDCDGTNDEDFGSAPITCGIGACRSRGELTCVNGETVSSCVPGIPAPLDSTCNGIDDDCDGEIDEDCTAIISSASGKIGHNRKANIQIFPNPAKDIINIGLQMENDVINKILLVNSLGQKMEAAMLPVTKGHVVVDISGFQPGLYFMHILTNDVKVIKPVAIK